MNSYYFSCQKYLMVFKISWEQLLPEVSEIPHGISKYPRNSYYLRYQKYLMVFQNILGTAQD